MHTALAVSTHLLLCLWGAANQKTVGLKGLICQKYSLDQLKHKLNLVSTMLRVKHACFSMSFHVLPLFNSGCFDFSTWDFHFFLLFLGSGSEWGVFLWATCLFSALPSSSYSINVAAVLSSTSCQLFILLDSLAFTVANHFHEDVAMWASCQLA